MRWAPSLFATATVHAAPARLVSSRLVFLSSPSSADCASRTSIETTQRTVSHLLKAVETVAAHSRRISARSGHQVRHIAIGRWTRAGGLTGNLSVFSPSIIFATAIEAQKTASKTETTSACGKLRARQSPTQPVKVQRADGRRSCLDSSSGPGHGLHVLLECAHANLARADAVHPT